MTQSLSAPSPSSQAYSHSWHWAIRWLPCTRRADPFSATCQRRQKIAPFLSIAAEVKLTPCRIAIVGTKGQAALLVQKNQGVGSAAVWGRPLSIVPGGSHLRWGRQNGVRCIQHPFHGSAASPGANGGFHATMGQPDWCTAHGCRRQSPQRPRVESAYLYAFYNAYFTLSSHCGPEYASGVNYIAQLQSRWD